MTQAASALERNAGAGLPQPDAHAKRLDLRQEMIVKEFITHYDIRREQIFFDPNSDEPYFDFEALSLLVNELADIPSIKIAALQTDAATGFASASCEIVLADGRKREYSGSAFITEAMPGGGHIADFRQALEVAQTRALRKTLRAISFNPVRAHEAKKAGADINLQITDPRTMELREAHKLGEELGFIEGDDKSLWRRHIKDFTRGECESMEAMDEKTRGHFVIYLRALKRNDKARTGAPDTPGRMG